MQTLRMTYPQKWWFILAHGIFLVGMVYLVIQPQGKGLFDFQMNLTWVALFQGLILVLGYFITSSFDKNVIELSFGILYFTIALVSRVITFQNPNDYVYLIAGYLLLNVFLCAGFIWNLRSSKWSWVFMLFLLPYTGYLIFLFEMFPSTGNPVLLKFTGIHFIICGITMILMAFAFRKMQIDFSKPIKNLFS